MPQAILIHVVIHGLVDREMSILGNRVAHLPCVEGVFGAVMIYHNGPSSN